MALDFFLFDLVNGLAGRWPWLDALGRALAVYGLLGVVLIGVAVAWQPGTPASLRRRYLLALLAAGALCALLMWAESCLVIRVLGHELRSRPANARWATLLITESAHLSFPAWPAALAFAAGLPTVAVLRGVGMAQLLLGALVGLALVFAGVNYPFDVITGAGLGLAIGYTGALAAGLGAPTARRARRLAAVWAALALWGAIIAVVAKPASVADESRMKPATAASLRVAAPAGLAAALAKAARPGTARVEAASNGHITAGWVRVSMPSPALEKAEVEALARQVVNAAFEGWARLDVVTLAISAGFPRGTGEKVGTLYAVSVARADWPAGGFRPGRPLPGRKFFHARFYHSQAPFH